MFLANYSDGLTDAPLPEMIDKFKESGKIACFLAVRPPLTYHLADIDEDGRVQRIPLQPDSPTSGSTAATSSSASEIFDYMRDGEELVLEPFQRLIEDGQLMAYKHEGFWRAMDTLRDRQVLEDMVEKGDMPWRRQMPRARPAGAAGGGVMRRLRLAGAGERLLRPLPRRPFRRHRDRRGRHAAAV